MLDLQSTNLVTSRHTPFLFSSVSAASFNVPAKWNGCSSQDVIYQSPTQTSTKLFPLPRITFPSIANTPSPDSAQ